MCPHPPGPSSQLYIPGMTGGALHGPHAPKHATAQPHPATTLARDTASPGQLQDIFGATKTGPEAPLPRAALAVRTTSSISHPCCSGLEGHLPPRVTHRRRPGLHRVSREKNLEHEFPTPGSAFGFLTKEDGGYHRGEALGGTCVVWGAFVPSHTPASPIHVGWGSPCLWEKSLSSACGGTGV